MKWSAAEVALVPTGLVTVTSTVPAARGGETAVTSVELTTVKLVAAVVRKATEVAPVKLVPVIVTTVPPVMGPAVGEMDVTVGAATVVVVVSGTVVEVVVDCAVVVVAAVVVVVVTGMTAAGVAGQEAASALWTSLDVTTVAPTSNATSIAAGRPTPRRRLLCRPTGGRKISRSAMPAPSRSNARMTKTSGLVPVTGS